MNEQIFQKIEPKIIGNKELREPQEETYKKVIEHYANTNPEREIGIVLPVGCGKTGAISLIPFGVKANRVLILAPNTTIRDELKNNLNPSHEKYFYLKRVVLEEPPYPEMVAIENKKINQSILDVSDVVITNIGQLQREDNIWINSLPPDYFDVILVDEAHHNIANSWVRLINKFKFAKIINFTATPRRADGELMSGKIIYQYPVYKAEKNGYIKKITAWVLNPATLKYFNKDTQKEYHLQLEEIRKKAENDSDFRKSIVQSEETLNTIVDASIRALEKIRNDSGDKKHAIIAAAQNYTHCHDIVRAYKARNLKVDFVHSKEDSKANEKVKEKLKNNELDVIVQVNMLGEGFDHPHLSVAAIFKIFRSLSPFVQFVGRIMRVVHSNTPNRGIVVFHVGTNIAKLWDDFQDFSVADQEFYDNLLPQDIKFKKRTDIIEIDPVSSEMNINPIEISEQENIELSEIALLKPKAIELVTQLKKMGVTEEMVQKSKILKPVHVSKQKKWEADLKWIDSNVSTAVGRILAQRKINHAGHELDKKYTGKDNYVYFKSEIDKAIAKFTGIPAKNARKDLTIEKVEKVKNNLKDIISKVEKNIF